MLIGRKKEIALLQEALESPKAEMIAVIGRRRVGKTFLVDTIYKDRIIFKQTGVRNAPNEAQLRTFTQAVEQLAGETLEVPRDWLDAFFLLRKHLEAHISKDKKVVLFFDELSWLAVPKSNFLDYLGHFWNDWAYQQNVVIVLCGSASSWVIQKVINDKGGLHNRVTRYLHLKPFTLQETELYLQSKHCTFTKYQIVQMYMAFGGVPLYLEEIKRGKSAVQNINDICFSETGLLKNEFNRLYPALFENADDHIAVIRALASKKKGLSRTEIIETAKVANGSSTSKVLEELEQSDFIMAYHPFKKKKKDKIYRLIDEYSLFYLRFIENTAFEGAGTFMQLSNEQAFKIWCGYAFEGICMKHVQQIKKALGVSGVYTTTYSYLRKATPEEKGLQIDMLLERADRVINLFEIKFYDREFSFTKAYADQLRERLHLFKRLSKTRSQVWITMITTFGLKHNMHSLGLVEKVLTLEDLFLGE
ncbi:MAG: AAA family ATPase [Lewinellaceae bacterium]|nr:AAA family ATPase [Phaeodactylibacter sp.]MCB9039724.1 AAA family ATPase [Lewinellaceae bacterium]